jgi:probable HAF family extracellular repeat protein
MKTNEKGGSMKSAKLNAALGIIVCIAMCLVFIGRSEGVEYTYIELLPPEWNNALAEDINNNGTVVGWGKGGESAFIYSGGQYTELLPPVWIGAQAFGINDSGMLVGSELYGSTCFTYSNGLYTYLFPDGAVYAYANDINNKGEVVGYGQYGNGIQKGFIYSGGQYTELLPPGWTQSRAISINDNSDVAGAGSDGIWANRGFIYSGGQYTYPKPPEWQSVVWVTSINNNGDMAGVGQDGNGIQKGFFYSGGQYTELLPPGWKLLYNVTSLNNKGEVAGCGDDGNGIIKGFVYSGGQYAELSPPGSLSTFASSINDNGVVVGYFDYGSPNGPKGFIATPKTSPSCVSVNPSSGIQGQTLDVTITGENTNFNETSEVFLRCANITVPWVNSITPISPTELQANITIDRDASLGICDVTVTTGSEMSCVDVFSIQAPTIVTLAGFKAEGGKGKIVISWFTESETDNAGFNIYRAKSENGDYVKLTREIIPTKGFATQGASYEFTDTHVQNRKTYYYKLEDIDNSGISTFHGPASATPRWIYGVGR